MSNIIIMPKLGFNMSEGKLLKWYKNEGDPIEKGEPLFSIETDKTNIDIEATSSGVLRKILLTEGETVPVTTPIALVAEADEDIQKELSELLGDEGSDSSDDTGAKSKTPGNADLSDISDTPQCQGEQKSPSVPLSFDFDIIILGAGPGGYVAAIKAAQLGKRTALVEKDSLGGVCLNRGCIPTKTLLKSVQVLKEVKECESFGVTHLDTSHATLDMHVVQKRKKDIVSQLTGGVLTLLKKNGVTIISGAGEIEDKHTIKCGDKSYTASHIIIATGSVAKSLHIPSDPGMEILTSDRALDMTDLPGDITIIGAGVVGIEFAYFFALCGCKVTVIEFLDNILSMVDGQVAKKAASMLEGLGVKIYTGAEVKRIEKDSVVFEKDKKQGLVKASAVMISVGRSPSLSGIDCDKLNISTEKGAVKTDDTLRTSVDNIYAIGDVNGRSMLAHTASMEAIVAVKNICGMKAAMDYDKIPYAVFTQPELSGVGLTQEQAMEKYGDVKVGVFPMYANGKAKVEGEENGMVKVIVEPVYGEIVGVHLFCPHASDMISEAVVAMNMEATAHEIAESVHPHPTFSEVYHEAFLASLGKAIHTI